MPVGPGTELDQVDEPEDDFDPIDPSLDPDLELDDADDLPLDEEEEEPALGGAPDPEPAAAAPASRGERRFQAMSERVRAAEERAAAAERQSQEAARTRQQEDFRQQEADRLANMSEGERIEYRVNQRLNQMQFTTWDTNDRVEFQALAASNPAVGALKAEVEALFKQRMAAGTPVDRTTIAKFLIGEKALSRAPRARAAGQRAAQAGRERNTVRAPASRGDIPANGRRTTDERAARAARLADVNI